MMPYIAFFSSLALLSCFTFLGDRNLKIAAVLLAVLLSVLFAGLRDGVGVDAAGYELYFDNVETIHEVVFGSASYSSVPRPYEPAFYYLMAISKQISQDFSIFKIISSFIIVSCILRAYFLLTKDYSFAFFLFFSVLFLSIVFHQFRNGLAIGFFALALAHCANNRLFWFSVYALISISFHLSAVFLLFVPFLRFFSFGLVPVILVLGAGYIFKEAELFSRIVEFIFADQTQGENLFESKILGKFNSQKYQDKKIEFGLGFIKAVLLLFGLLLRDHKRKLSDLEQWLAKSYLFGVGLFIVLSNYGIFASRTFMYFGLLEPVLILSILFIVKEKSVVLLVFFMYFFVHLLVNSSDILNFPYHSIL
jgi:hypothetical protein